MPQQHHQRSSSFSWIVAAGGLAALLVAPPTAVDGHVYVVESRQYYNSPVYQADDFKNLEKNAGAYNAGGQVEVQKRARKLTDPALLKEYGDGYYPLRWVYDKGEMAPNGNYIEPEGISVRHGVCGDPKSGDQGGKDGENTYSTPNRDWPILQEFKQGQVMEIKAVMKAWHYGHLEFFLCDTGDLADPGGVATQECFNKYPLTRAEGDGVNSPVDPQYPGRYYADPPCRENETEQDYDWRAGGGYVMTMNYQLPKDLVCEHCVLQMWYYTGHKCYHPGYEEFNPPSWGSECAPNKSDWIDLSIDYCGDNEWNLAEEFWACSDLSISADGSTPPADDEPTDEATDAPTATPADDDKPTASPVAVDEDGGAADDKPTDGLTAAPTAAPTDAPTATPADEKPTADNDDKPTATPADDKPTDTPTDAPTDGGEEGEGEGGEKAEYIGCFHDNKEDRVLGNQLSLSTMTTEVCQKHCTEQGALYMATQFGFECWCSADGGLDYERHYEEQGKDAVCDLFCQGDKTQPCGGFNSFDLYKLPTCSGSPVEAYEQCGGGDYTGSTCCTEGNECIAMGDGCYSQCRPTTDTTPEETETAPTPSPVTEEEEQPTPAPVASEPPTTAPVASEPPTVAPVAIEPTAAPVAVDPTASPVDKEEPASDGCMVVMIEAEDMPLTGDWSVVSDADASGGKYITWLGLEPSKNNQDANEGDIISTSIDIPTAGTYSFKWRMRQPDGVDSDKGNDAWLYFPDADRYGPADSASNNYGEFIKVYGRATKGEFEYSGTGEDSNGHTQIALEFDQPGEYTMEISGRSHGLQIDQILVFGEELSVDDAAANTGC